MKNPQPSNDSNCPVQPILPAPAITCYVHLLPLLLSLGLSLLGTYSTCSVYAFLCYRILTSCSFFSKNIHTHQNAPRVINSTPSWFHSTPLLKTLEVTVRRRSLTLSVGDIRGDGRGAVFELVWLEFCLSACLFFNE